VMRARRQLMAEARLAAVLAGGRWFCTFSTLIVTPGFQAGQPHNRAASVTTQGV
jgi:hypothetical protein